MSDPGSKYGSERLGRIDAPHPWAAAAGIAQLTCDDVRTGFGGWRVWKLGGLPPRPIARRAAVLVPLFDDDDGQCRVLLIERAHHTGSHRGELAFPGGITDDGESPAETALREAHEELALDTADVEVLGHIVAHTTYVGDEMQVIAGVLPGRPAITPNPEEVARCVEVRLVDLLSPGAFWLESWGEERHEIPFFQCGDDVAFGVTAGVLMMLLDAAVTGHAHRSPGYA